MYWAMGGGQGAQGKRARQLTGQGASSDECSAVQSSEAPHWLSVTLVQTSRTSASVPRLYTVQAAWKAVVSKKYSDIKHLSGGVYGDRFHQRRTFMHYSVNPLTGFCMVLGPYLWLLQFQQLLRGMLHAVQVGTRQICPSKVSMTWRMLAGRPML